VEVPLAQAGADVGRAAAAAAAAAGETPFSALLPDGVAGLVAGVSREVKGREASLACHKLASPGLEALLFLLPAPALARFLGRALTDTSYLRFVATNRFGSHVVEGALGVAWEYLAGVRGVEWAGAPASVAYAAEEEEVGGGGSGGGSAALPATVVKARDELAAAVLEVARAATRAVADLVFDPCGTHVLRAVAALLAGRRPVAHKRGMASVPAEAGAGGGAGGAGQEAQSGAGGGGGAAAGRPAGAAPTPPAPAAPRPPAPLAGPAPPSPATAAAFVSCLVDLAHAIGEADAQPDGAPADGSRMAVAAAAPRAEAADSALVGMACDMHASPTLQHLLDALLAIAPGTARYLTRRLCGWGVATLPAADLDGSGDLAALAAGGAGSGSGGGAAVGGAAGRKRKRAGEGGEGSGGGDGAAAAAAAAAEGGAEDGAYVEVLLSHPIGSRLLEAALTHADGPLVHAMYVTTFRGRLAALSRHASANFVVQRLLVSCRSLEDAERAVAELLPAVPELVAAKREGVVWHMAAAVAGGAALAAAAAAAPAPAAAARPAPGGGGGGGGHAVRLPVVPVFAGAAEAASATVQGKLLAALSSAAGVPAAGGGKGGPNLALWWLDAAGYRADAAAAVASVSGGSGGRGIEPIVTSPVGARIVATLLHCGAPVASAVGEALTSAPAPLLAALAADPFASRHIFEALLADARPDLEWLRNKLLGSLRGQYGALAATRFGCWVVSKAFAAADVKRKRGIVEELAAAERAISGTPGGRAVLKAARLEHYRQNEASWEASWGRVTAKAALFADLLDGGGASGGAGASAVPPAAAAAPAPAHRDKRAKVRSEEAAPAAPAPRPGGKKVDAMMGALGF